MPSLRRKPDVEEAPLEGAPSEETPVEETPVEAAPVVDGPACPSCGGLLEPFPADHPKAGRSVCTACGRSTPAVGAA